MKQYIELCKEVLESGNFRSDRTGTGTLSYFGSQYEHDLSAGFPLLTTKDMSEQFDKIVGELLWFLRGDTNLKYLHDLGIGIWDADAHRVYRGKGGTLNLKEFRHKLRTSESFMSEHGSLGKIYGHQWRSWGLTGFDQVMEIVRQLKEDPYSRRMLVNAWNVSDIPFMALPPCHVLWQVYVEENEDGHFLHLKVYQRSGDLLLGVPFNLASYALLLIMLAQVAGLKPGRIIHSFGDVHIYENHLAQVEEQVLRKPYPLPTVKIKNRGQAIDEFVPSDFELQGYQSHGAIKGSLSVG